MLLLDFNYFQSDLKTPIELVDDFIDDFDQVDDDGLFGVLHVV